MSQSEKSCPVISEISQTTQNGFSLYVKQDGIDYLAILNQFRSGTLLAEKLENECRDRDVYQITLDGRYYILKHDREVDRRFEKLLWQWLGGPFYSNMMKKVNFANSQGCDFVQDIFLVAEKLQNRICVESFVLMEYKVGQPLSHIAHPQQYYPQILDLFSRLHRFRLASNDIHLGNFIVGADGQISIIDLSARGARAICQANDVIALKNKFGLSLPVHGLLNYLVYRLIAAKQSLRSFSRMLRKKR